MDVCSNEGLTNKLAKMQARREGEHFEIFTLAPPLPAPTHTHTFTFPLPHCAQAEFLTLAAGFLLLKVRWQWFMTEGRSEGKQPTTGCQNKGKMSRGGGEYLEQRKRWREEVKTTDNWGVLRRANLNVCGWKKGGCTTTLVHGSVGWLVGS